MADDPKDSKPRRKAAKAKPSKAAKPAKEPVSEPSIEESISKILCSMSPQAFQEFVEVMLQAEGHEILEKGGTGPDGEKDSLIKVKWEVIGSFEERWVVQVKHRDKRDTSTEPREISNFWKSCNRWSAVGFLLVTNGTLTDKCIRELAGFNGPLGLFPIKGAFWRFSDLHSMITTKPSQSEILRTYFPEVRKRIGPRLAGPSLAEFLQVAGTPGRTNEQLMEMFTAMVQAIRPQAPEGEAHA